MKAKNDRHLVDWPAYTQNLISVQCQMYNMKFNLRNLRNFQRFIRKSFLNRALIINYIIQNKYKQKQFDKIVYFNSILELDFDIQLDKLHYHSYRTYIKIKLENILWLLAYLPVHERFSNERYLQTRLTDQNQPLIHDIQKNLVDSSTDLIQLVSLPNQLCTRVKYWLMKFSFFEYKYLIYWFLNYQLFHYKNIYDQIWLAECSILSLYDIIKAFYIYCFIFFYQLKKKNPIGPYWIYFNYMIDLNNNLSLITIPSIKYNLKNQFHLFGWCLQKKNLIIQKSISDGNIYFHQQEIVKFLKNSGTYPIDKVITLLNYKIKIWKHYYISNTIQFQVINRLNKYLFHRIWYFIKKRHKNKGVRWIIYHYFKNDKINQKNWIFEYNQIRLITYN